MAVECALFVQEGDGRSLRDLAVGLDARNADALRGRFAEKGKRNQTTVQSEGIEGSATAAPTRCSGPTDHFVM